MKSVGVKMLHPKGGFDSQWVGRGLFTLILLVTLLGFATLSRSPMPWFDEVYMASIGDAVRTNGEFNLGINPLRLQQELTYGPVYPVIQGLLFELFGLGIITARLPGFISGLGVAFFLFHLLRGWGVSRNFCLSAVLILLSDYMFGRGMYSGRMDLLAMLFLFSSLFTLQKFGERSLLGLLVAGSFASTAFLTTPRVAFAAIGLPFFLADLSSNRLDLKGTIKNIGVFTLPGVVMGLLWVYYAFGGFSELFVFFRSERRTMNFVGGSGFFRHLFEYHIYFVSILAVAFVLRSSKDLSHEMKAAILGFGAAIIGYNLLVTETGPYSSMVIPIYLGFIFLATKNGNFSWTRRMTLALLGTSLALFIAKKSVIVSEFRQRDSSRAVAALQKIDIEGKTILADYKYFYTLEAMGSNFVSWKTLKADFDCGNEGVTFNRIEELLDVVSYVVIDRQRVSELREFLREFQRDAVRADNLSDGTTTAILTGTYEAGYFPDVFVLEKSQVAP